jgi:hypothetical protein
MLGLSSGLIYSSYLTGISNPTDVSDLIGWWDFTDNTNGNLSNSHSSASAPSDGDAINRIKNKAYHLQNDTNTAIGESLYASTFSVSTSNAMAPIFKASSSDTANRPPNESSSNPISYGYFYQRSSGSSTYVPYMRCRWTTYSGESSPYYLGTVKSDDDLHTNLSTSSISTSAHTVFTVERRVNSISDTGAVWAVQGFDSVNPASELQDSIFGAGVATKNTLRWYNDFHRTFDSPFSGSLNSTTYELNATNAGTVRRRMWMPHNPDVDASTQITNNSKFTIWTNIANGSSSTTTSQPYLRGGRMYRNTDTTKGIDIDTYTSIANTQDESSTAGSDGVHDFTSGDTNKLNLGMLHGGGVNSTFLTPLEFSLGMLNIMGDTSGALSDTPAGRMPIPLNHAFESNHAKVSTYGFSRGTAIYEILFYNKVLSVGEISGVENYLKNKYGDPEDLY